MVMKLSPFFTLVAILGVLCGTRSVPASETDDGSAGIRGSHSAATKCVQCHGSEPVSPDAAALVAPVPELCATCHNEYASLQGWVHGPAVTGDCTFCHDSHQSEYGSLLTKPIPELCYDCHTTETLRLVMGHSDYSYRHCDTCHESHVGTNRKLLKENFLSSEAGNAYRDEMTFRQPQYTFVDRRASLAGLRGVRIIPSVERRDLLTRYGVTAEAVQAKVERRLREGNVKILSDEGQAVGQPGLYVYLRLVELHFPGYSDQVCALSGTVDMSLRQTVELVSQPSDAERRICLASTWDTSAVVVWGIPQVQEGLSNAIGVLMDRFCSDYRAANPISSESEPGQDSPESLEHQK